MLEEEIKLTADSSQAEKELDKLAEKTKDINKNQQQEQTQELISVKDNFKTLTDAIKDLSKEIKENNSVQNTNFENFHPLIESRIQKNKLTHEGIQVDQLGKEAGSVITSVAKGDYFAPITQSLMSTSDKIKSFGDRQLSESGDGEEGGSILGGLGGLLSKIGSIFGGLLSMIGGFGIGITLGGMALGGATDRYEADLPQTTRILASFGNTLTSDADKNQELADTLRSTLVDYNRNTGLENNEFLDYASTLSRFGIGAGQEIKVGQMTQKAANLALLTNGDIGQNLDFMGLIERFGGNGIETINQAYNSARIQGLDKNQFPEFLSNLQRVIEDGISKGYIKSTKEVATDLAIFSTLGQGNAFFEGEYGARTYAQMSNGLANSTNLNSTSSFLVFRAAQDTIDAIGVANALNTNDKGGVLNSIKDTGASWLNTMAYIESGPMNSDFLKNLSNQVNLTYGNDTASKVLTYKEAFGLNYQGAIRMYNLMDELSKTENAGQIEKIKSQMDEVTSTPEFKSAETALADSMSKLDKTLHNLSKTAFSIKSETLDKIASTVDTIANIINPDIDDNDFTPQKENLYLVENYDINEQTKAALSVNSGTDKLSWAEILNNDIPDYYRQGYLREVVEDYTKTIPIHNNIEELYKKDAEDGKVSKDILLEYNALTSMREFLVGNPSYWEQDEQIKVIAAFRELQDHIQRLTVATTDAARAYINGEIDVTQ